MCNPLKGYWPEGPRREGTDVKVKGPDGVEFNVHIARPDGDPPYKTVLVIHDYFDPEHYYHELASRFAGAGYLGVVPHLFERQGPLSEQTHEVAGQRIGNVRDEQVFGDVDAVLEYLRTEGLLGDLVVCGFCWGGRMAYLLAARHPDVNLVLPFYGHLTAWTGPGGAHPNSPMGEAEKINAPVIGSYGGADASIPLDQVAEMEAKLKAKGQKAELKIYEGAGHCFFMTPENAPQSDDAWARALAALKETVG